MRIPLILLNYWQGLGSRDVVIFGRPVDYFENSLLKRRANNCSYNCSNDGLLYSNIGISYTVIDYYVCLRETYTTTL